MARRKQTEGGHAPAVEVTVVPVKPAVARRLNPAKVTALVPAKAGSVMSAKNDGMPGFMRQMVHKPAHMEEKAWTDEARASAIEARRARSRKIDRIGGGLGRRAGVVAPLRYFDRPGTEQYGHGLLIGGRNPYLIGGRVKAERPFEGAMPSQVRIVRKPKPGTERQGAFNAPPRKPGVEKPNNPNSPIASFDGAVKKSIDGVPTGHVPGPNPIGGIGVGADVNDVTRGAYPFKPRPFGSYGQPLIQPTLGEMIARRFEDIWDRAKVKTRGPVGSEL